VCEKRRSLEVLGEREEVGGRGREGDVRTVEAEGYAEREVER
jgi:hypothetical protein